MAISKITLPNNTTQDIKDARIAGIDSSPTQNSTNVVQSGGVYDEVHPALEDTQPATGMLPNRIYNFGELTADTTFLLNTTDVDSNVGNHYFFTFSEGTTPYVVTWPSQITGWSGGAAPTLLENHYYEVSILNGVASYMEA